METQQKTPVQVVQELIALHTTRKEACQKIMENGADQEVIEKATAAAGQSDAAIAALLAELAQFGDAVGASVDRDNPYQELYKQLLDDLKAPAAAANAFRQLEDSLKITYKQLMDAQTDLPPTLQQLIQKQYEALDK